MNILGKLFGSKSKVPMQNSASADALAVIEDAVSMIDKKILHLERENQGLLKSAKDLASTDKPKALNLLRKKKLNEKQIEALEGQRLNLETQLHALQNMRMDAIVIEATAVAARALKANNVDVDKLSDLQDQIAESLQDAQEVSQLLSQPIAQPDIDLDDLEAELQALEDEDLQAQLDAELLDAGAQARLPDVPNNKLSEEEQELAQLVADLA